MARNLKFELVARVPYKQGVSDGVNHSINASTRLCAVFGHPIRHSASPAMHNAAFTALGLNWRYLAFEVHPDNLRAAIDGAKNMGFLGLNLTVPHKLLAVDMVDAIDPQASKLGAVNTIVFEAEDLHGNWKPLASLPEASVKEIRSHGYNTDASALIQSLTEEFKLPDLRGLSVLLLGAGGAARSAALRLAEENIGALHLVNRTRKNSDELADLVRKQFPRLLVKHGYPDGSVDLVINATSLGLKADDVLPMDMAWWKKTRPPRAYDMIYRPKETAFLRSARETGATAANGLGMLLHQGAEAFTLWSGRPAPVQVMRAALEESING